MAVWQFDLQLMPNSVIADVPQCIDSAITDDGLDTTAWWLPNQPKVEYGKLIATAFSPLDSWCHEILRWGDEGKVLIEAFIENGKLEGLGVRIDVRNVDRESITKIVQLATILDCHIYVMETQQVVPPTVQSLLPHLVKSRAVEFARDPNGFIERAARENAT